MPELFVPEERWGAGQLGGQPPADGARADPPRPAWRRATATGASRRRTSPRAATRSTASTRSAWTRAATRPTTTARSSTPAGRAARAVRRSPIRRRRRTPTASSRRTPRSSALRYAPRETLANLRRLARDFPGLYGKWGFSDSVNVDTGVVSGAYLSLDQGMIMAAIGNALGDDMLRRAFADARLERALRPVMGVEEFGADPRGCTITGTRGRRPAAWARQATT